MVVDSQKVFWKIRFFDVFEDFVAFPEYFLGNAQYFTFCKILQTTTKSILERQQNLKKTSKNLIFQKTFWESNHHVSSQKVTKSSQNLIFQKTFWESNCIEQTWCSILSIAFPEYFLGANVVVVTKLISQKTFWESNCIEQMW